MDGSADLLTTQEVARLAGVGATAVKRWTEAGLLPCVRTAGGHRRFPRAGVEGLLRRRGQPEPERDPWVDALLEGGDPRGLEALLLSARAREGSWWRVARLAGEALGRLGRRWEVGEVSILAEHRASERLARALARVVEAIPLDPRAPRALLACAEGDDHTLGLALVEVVLREAGWATDWAGRRTPVEAEALAPALEGVRLLCVSASAASRDARALRRQAGALATAARGAGALLVLGGAGAWPARPRGGARFGELEAFHRFAVDARERVDRRG